MEADWSVEIGAELPVIAVPWKGFVDLREASRITKISEAVADPALAVALVRLNAPASPLFTSKCDSWALAAEEIDPFEFDASRKEALVGLSCYIDVIARDGALFASFAAHEDWAQASVLALRKITLSQATVEFVVRQSFVGEREGFAMTLYVSACGAHDEAARRVFELALDHAITATIEASATAGE